jgi:hypothetical protein
MTVIGYTYEAAAHCIACTRKRFWNPPKRTVIQELVRLGKHKDSVYERVCRNFLPSGSGIDSGCTIDSISDDRIVIHSSYHKMNDNGYYCGWVDFQVIVTADLEGINIRVRGRNGGRLDDSLREYLWQVFDHELNREIESQGLYTFQSHIQQATDREGNPVHPIFLHNEMPEEGYACSDCGSIIYGKAAKQP